MKSSEAKTPSAILYIIVSAVFWSSPALFILISVYFPWMGYMTAAGRIAYFIILTLVYLVVMIMTVIMAVKIRKQGVVIRSQFIILTLTEIIAEAVMALTPIVVPFASKMILGGAE